MSDEKTKEKILDHAPKLTLSLCATLLAFALTVRIIGIDISTPINNILNAKAELISAEAKLKILRAKPSNSDIDGAIDDLNKRLIKIERAHSK